MGRKGSLDLEKDGWFEGEDGEYHMEVFNDLTFRLETPSGVADGKIDPKSGSSPQFGYQDPDIEDWLLDVGNEAVQVAFGDAKTLGDCKALGGKFDPKTKSCKIR